MNKIFKIIVIAGFSMLVTTACNDEFLERFPETAIGKENFFNSEEDLELYINNLYDFPGVWAYTGDEATDNAATTGAANSGNTELKNMMIGNPSSQTLTGGWTWSRLRTINLFLENFHKADISEQALNHYEGLARFFRARFYVEKVKRYSDVPWYDFVIESDDEEALFKERDPRDFVVDRIMEDFKYAATHVQDDSRAGAVDNWVVKTYYARFALYEGTFRKYHSELELSSTADQFLQKAIDISMDIMNNSGFSIYSTGNVDRDYHNLFNNTNLEGNSEIILATFSENEILNSGWWEFMFGNYEVCPTKDLLQSYLMADGSYYTDQGGYESNLFVEEFRNRDLRLYQTYAYPGWELINTATYSQGGGIYIQQLQKNFSGYHQIKGFLNTRDNAVHNSVDFPVLRFAEVLLTYAEAKAELGELSQGDLDMTVNVLRDRAGMPHMNMNPPVDAVQQARYPNISSSTSQWATLLEIRRERRIELALEGFRFDDLNRWGAGEIFEIEPQGLFFPSLGKYDLTGDGIEDIILIPGSESIPTDKEKNSLGADLIYFTAGVFGESVDIFLENSDSGNIQTIIDRGTFVEPKYYYRPIPQSQITLNPNLKQIMEWD